ncbi:MULTISPECIES: RHE_PE00001 family protein [unclassified Rhizobium]|uniref:RHE_PE00001 family protein n=1 Tax=unclassified Rhizobium TaxID=2613769 RepID=UPI00288A9B44|nr:MULTISPECIES: RHE_PE00001 family protein [unclassified Rhizobium]
MLYDVDRLPLSLLMLPVARATEAVARLDERVSQSPFREGFLERQDFHETVSSLWVDGELVHIEDLVLHDAHMDIRAPTHEVVIASRILRARRRMFSHEPIWALSPTGLSRLRGEELEHNATIARDVVPADILDVENDDPDDSALNDEMSTIDRLIARSSATLDTITKDKKTPPQALASSLTRDPDWNETDRLNEWRTVLQGSIGLPATLRAAIALDAWQRLEVLQRSPWLGRQLASALLREEALTQAHLVTTSVGLRAISRERRNARTAPDRLIAFLDAIYEAATLGLKEHDRLLQAKNRIERKLVGRRSNSRLPELIALVLSRPVVSTSMIVKALGTTPQGAVGLANQLELREMTGRGRFRAWGVL